MENFKSTCVFWKKAVATFCTKLCEFGKQGGGRKIFFLKIGKNSLGLVQKTRCTVRLIPEKIRSVCSQKFEVPKSRCSNQNFHVSRIQNPKTLIFYKFNFWTVFLGGVHFSRPRILWVFKSKKSHFGAKKIRRHSEKSVFFFSGKWNFPKK